MTPRRKESRSRTGRRWKRLVDGIPKTCCLVSESYLVRSNRAVKIGTRGVLSCVTYGM